jgi:hypothetical protein
MACPVCGLRRLVLVVVVLAGSCLGSLVAGIVAIQVSRNKSPPLQPPAAPAPTPSPISCRSFHPPCSDPDGVQIDLRLWHPDQAPFRVDLLLATVSAGFSTPAASSTASDFTAPSQQSSALESHLYHDGSFPGFCSTELPPPGIPVTATSSTSSDVST